MIIQVHMIPEQNPLQISFVIPQEVMNGCLKAYEKVPFEAPVKCDVTLQRTEEDVWVQAQVAIQADPICDRCLGEFNNSQEKSLQFNCIPSHPSRLDDEEDNVFFYHGKDLDLSPMIREMVLLDRPMINLCDESCRGLCRDCGTNLNLGDHSHACEKSVNFPQKIQNL